MDPRKRILILTIICAIAVNIFTTDLLIMQLAIEYNQSFIDDVMQAMEDQPRRPRKRPRLWMTAQSTQPSWYDRVLMTASDDDIWVMNFRIPKQEVMALCRLLSDDMSPEEMTVRAPIPLEKRVCVAIYTLASCAEYRTVVEVFGVSVMTVHRYLNKFCESMAKKKGLYIKWYEDLEAAEIADLGRRNYCYPQSIGAIDGTHIPITPPADGKADFINRKGYPSLVLQAVVDDKGYFRGVCANTPGSAHDSTVFRRSPRFTKIQNEMPSRAIAVNGHTVPLHLLGDPAYPLSSKIIKGFVGRGLSAQEESINVYHSSARICVEIAFGRLKSRWRMLRKTLDCDYKFSPKLVITCCMLHNICEQFKIPPLQYRAGDDDDAQLFGQPALVRYGGIDDNDAIAMCQAITDHLAESVPLRRAFHL